jgi:hypothetical protein
LTAAQVQIAWVEETSDTRVGQLNTPAARIQLTTDLMVALLRHLKRYYPNVQIAYVSSEPYGGYDAPVKNPQASAEPYLYENAFAVRNLIAGQDGSAPAIVWGPYQWADGLTPRNDGLVWTCADFDRGGHLSPEGATKAAQLLVDFFGSDSSAGIWLSAR